MINDINKEKQTENKIKELGVFELRGLARQLGVPSPTTKKRDELISLILEAIKNGKRLTGNLPKRGRPYKRLNILDSLTNKIAPNTNESMDYKNIVRFAQEVSPVVDKVERDNQVYTFEGIVRKLDDNCRIYDLKNNKCVYICDDVDFYSYLESGDRVKVEAKSLPGEKYFMALNILEINNTSPKIYEPIPHMFGEEIIDSKTFPYANGEVFVGRRNIFKSKQDLFENDDFENVYNYCKGNGYHFITLGVNTSYETKIKLKNLQIEENFTTVYGTENDLSFNRILDVIFYSFNLVGRGEKVVVYITDIVEILRCLDQAFSEELYEDHANKAKAIMHKLLSFARSYDNGVSGTILMCYNESDNEDKFLTNELLKISKKIN